MTEFAANLPEYVVKAARANKEKSQLDSEP